MNARRDYSVPEIELNDIPASVMGHLKSEGLLFSAGHTFRFFHDSFFDYGFARWFVRDKRPISELLDDEVDDGFRRTQICYILSYKRSCNESDYTSDLQQTVTSAAIRPLLREAVLEFLGELDKPSPDEVTAMEGLMSQAREKGE